MNIYNLNAIIRDQVEPFKHLCGSGKTHLWRVELVVNMASCLLTFPR